jgi:uncharacterized protein YjbI with pentapeptide repeats
VKLNKPKITRSALVACSVGQLIADADLEQIVLSNADASGLQAKSLNIDEAVLEKVLFVEAALEKLSLTDTLLKNCDLSATNCANSSLVRTHITGGRITGADFSHGVLKDVVFEDCKLDIANFRFAKLTRVHFLHCEMVETDFLGTELQDVVFQDCHIEKVEFHNAKIKHVDARTSQLLNIRGWQSLKGMTVDSTQLITIAPQLAAELGLIIED